MSEHVQHETTCELLTHHRACTCGAVPPKPKKDERGDVGKEKA
jgi:hypothetical protein